MIGASMPDDSLEIASLVENSIARLPGVDPIPELDAVLQHATLSYLVREYEISIGLNDFIDDEVASLARIRPLNISCAPEVEVRLPLGAKASVLIKRYWACRHESLEGITLDHVRDHKEPFRAEAEARFRADLRRLAE